MQPSIGPEVPLSEQGRAITGGPQAIRHGVLLQRQTGLGVSNRVELSRSLGAYHFPPAGRMHDTAHRAPRKPSPPHSRRYDEDDAMQLPL